MSVDVFAADEQDQITLDTERWVRLAKCVLSAEGVAGDAEMSILFVDVGSIAELNLRFRGIEGPTDVLSFVIDEDVQAAEAGRSPDAGGPGPGWTPEESTQVPTLLGDIVICPEIAAANAPDHAGTFEDELALLVVHGILHLRGHDHEDEDEAVVMEAREQMLLDRCFRDVPGETRPGQAGAKA